MTTAKEKQTIAQSIIVLAEAVRSLKDGGRDTQEALDRTKAELSELIATKAASSHTHTIQEITDLMELLDSYTTKDELDSKLDKEVFDTVKAELEQSLAAVISRDEVRQMIAEAELDDLTLEQVQTKILAAVADKAAKQAVDEANREQDARIDELTEQLNALQSQPRLPLVTFEGEFDQYIKTPSDTMIQVSEGVYAPTYRYQRIVYVFNTNNTLLNTAIHDGLYLANYTRPKNSDAPQTSTPLPTGWRIEKGGQYVTLQEGLLFPNTTEEVQVIISHPDVEGTLTISLTHQRRDKAYEDYLNSIQILVSGDEYPYTVSATADDSLIGTVDARRIRQILWDVDGEGMGNHVFGIRFEPDQNQGSHSVNYKYLPSYGYRSPLQILTGNNDKPVKMLGFVLDDGTRVVRHF